MNTQSHSNGRLWRQGALAVGLSTLLATIVASPFSAAASPQQSKQPAPNEPIANQAPAANPAPQVDPGVMRFQSETFTLTETRGAAMQQTLEELSSPASPKHILVQLDGPVTDNTKLRYKDLGLELQTYVSNYAWFAKLSNQRDLKAGQIADLGSLRAATNIKTIWKLDDFLAQEKVPVWSIANQDYVAAKIAFDQAIEEGRDALAPTVPNDPIVGVYVAFHPDVLLRPTAQFVVAMNGGNVIEDLGPINSMVVEIPFNRIRDLAADESVMYIEPALPKFSPTNDSNRVRVQADVLQAAPYGLDGTGVNVLIYDAGFAFATHQDFGGRLTVYDDSGLHYHSTHVAGTVGGSGAASGGQFKGMAPNCTLISYGFDYDGSGTFLYTNPGDFLQDYGDAINLHGAVISNNSIGTNTAPNGFDCTFEGNYGLMSQLIDQVARGSLGGPIRIVWANGNERQSTRCLGGEGFQSPYHSTAPPACAKNHITVGALNSNDDSITTFTSFGPTDDGRIKPDISGPGCQVGADGGVTSVDNNATGYRTLCGTSMASPTVCGIGALILQAHRQATGGGPDITNATLKAALANTALDLGRPGPDYEYGHGSVRGQPAVDLVVNGYFREESISQGEVVTATVLVGPTDTELRVTLVWDDYPAAPNPVGTLVNDLDLHVYDSGNNRYYPYSLNPAAPTANATNTGENHVDNIEQIVIPNAAPGAYRIEVHGTNVPQGPQTFSIAGTPSLLLCADAGVVTLDGSRFACSDVATLTVIDCHLNADPGMTESVNVSISSDSEPGGETVTLSEIDPGVALLKGSIPISTTDAPGVLLVSPGDTITMSYIDADDGAGGTNVLKQTTAVIDCANPMIVGTNVSPVTTRTASIHVETGEPTMLTVHYGTACGALSTTVSPSGFNTDHTINLSGLSDDTTYYYDVHVTDLAGNVTIDNNGGACYTFTTLEIPDFFTQQYAAGQFNLDGTSILFVPDSNVDQYIYCRTPIATLPIDPAGGNVLPMSDTTSTNVAIGGGDQVQLYGTSYSSIYISSNGYITFAASDTDTTETIADHFDTPRVSLLFDDLDPSEGGAQVSWKKLSDRFVVTWLNVPQDGLGDSNTFQCQLYYDGRIECSWAGITPNIDCITGLSAGSGIDPDFFQSVLSSAGGCGPRPPSAANRNVEVPTGLPVNITLQATDDGTPAPASLDYIILSLPTYTLKDAGNNTVITPGMLPYTLTGGGNQVNYQSMAGFVGNDPFTFVVDDGGTPPDGGQSNIATVTIIVQPVLAVPFIDTFETPSAGPAGFDPGKWAIVSGATIDNQGIAPPSPTLAARFNGTPSAGDAITTHLVDLSNEGSVRVSYYYQQTGNGESPDSGDDLYVEYYNNAGSWIQLALYVGSGPDMTTFQYVEHLLPADALHPAFRLRLRNTATSGAFDDWFVDNVSIVSLNAPTAENVNVNVVQNGGTTITLDGDDPNGDPIEYTILSLPAHGTIRDAFNNAVINSVPYTLLSNGTDVFYQAMFGYSGPDTFTYQVSDGVNISNVGDVVIGVGGPQDLYFFPLNSNPGWATQGNWAFGVPTGGGTSGHDPTSGFTGTNVFGYNLNGNYENNMASTLYLTTAALDCTNATQVKLEFRRWLGIESSSFDHANVQVSNNGTTWTTIYDHSGASFSETSWSLQSYDISAIADNQPTVYIRWGMGPTDVSVTYPGWNIDDVRIIGNVPSPKVFGDFTGDGIVNVADLFSLLAVWGACPGCPQDLSGDGIVDVTDLFLLLANWTTGAAPRAEDILADLNKADVNVNTDVANEKFFVNDDVLIPAEEGGLFTTEQSYRQTIRGELGIEIAGRLPIKEADTVVIPGRALLNGKLTVWFADNFVPQPGDTFVVLVAGKVEGEFADVLLPALSELEGFGPDAHFELVYDESAVSLRVPGESAVENGFIVSKGVNNPYDVDRNGRVDVDDVLKLIDLWGPARRSRGDLNRDGVVDSQDLSILLTAPLNPRESAQEEEGVK